MRKKKNDDWEHILQAKRRNLSNKGSKYRREIGGLSSVKSVYHCSKWNVLRSRHTRIFKRLCEQKRLCEEKKFLHRRYYTRLRMIS